MNRKGERSGREREKSETSRDEPPRFHGDLVRTKLLPKLLVEPLLQLCSFRRPRRSSLKVVQEREVKDVKFLFRGRTKIIDASVRETSNARKDKRIAP